MIQFIKSGLLFICLLSIQAKSQINTVYVDTLQYEIINNGTTQTKQNQYLIITNNKEYSDFYYSIYSEYPKDFKFDFEKKMIVVYFETFSSGSSQLIIDAVTETYDKIIIKTHVYVSERQTTDISNKYIALSLKKSNKPIEVNIN